MNNKLTRITTVLLVISMLLGTAYSDTRVITDLEKDKQQQTETVTEGFTETEDSLDWDTEDNNQEETAPDAEPEIQEPQKEDPEDQEPKEEPEKAEAQEPQEEPKTEEIPETAEEPAEEEIPNTGNIIISEIMFKNDATLMDCDGDFSDWIELYNASEYAVSLSGWSLTDHEGGDTWLFPEIQIGSGEYLVVYASGKNYTDSRLHTDFTISPKKTVFLYDPAGETADSISCQNSKHDTSTIRLEDGSLSSTTLCTPGFVNTKEGYEEYQHTLNSAGPLQINEVLVTNDRYGYKLTSHYSDIVQLKNISGEPVNLADYFLSDNKLSWQISEITLQPGEIIDIYCDSDISELETTVVHAPFSLSSEDEQLFLSDSAGNVIDYAILRDIPLDGSYGRVQGEDGWFYFETPQLANPDKNNGRRFVSSRPEATVPGGSYPDAGQLTIELLADGTIYYTTDGSDPRGDALRYTGPITLSKTTVIRAYTVADGCIPSATVTVNYILNTPHDLPVLCLSTDSPGNFRSIWNNAYKGIVQTGNISFYDTDGGFSSDCGIELKGWTSLNDPKKSMGVSFKGIYGSTDLDYDIFGTGITDYDSLSIRAGQDYPLAVIRNEVAQTLCLEMTDDVYTQNSKYCVLYLNGRYYGIYCIKENISRSNYAIIDGVDKQDVTVLRSPQSMESDFYINYIYRFSQMDMSVPENYAEFCSVFDVDSLIDWFIMEGYCANTDINGNMKYIYSEKTGLWSIVFYDLDWAFTDSNKTFTNILKSNLQITPLFEALSKSPEFKDAVLTRYADVSKTVLSNEHVLELMDYFTNQIESEMNREKDRWGSSVSTWKLRLSQLRAFIEDDYSNYTIKRLCSVLNVSEEERIQYFGN